MNNLFTSNSRVSLPHVSCRSITLLQDARCPSQ